MRSTTPTDDGLDLGADTIHDQYDRGGFDELTDAQLFDRAAAVVSIPRRHVANSFVLHAPLELMARRLLLPLVPDHVRRPARERLLWVAARYEQAGDPLAARDSAGYDSVVTSGRALVAACLLYTSPSPRD